MNEKKSRKYVKYQEEKEKRDESDQQDFRFFQRLVLKAIKKNRRVGDVLINREISTVKYLNFGG